MLSSGTLSDEDYIVFGKMNNLGGVILDIGANYGYSVTSFVAAGCQLPIASFEPEQQYGPFLEAIRVRLPARYEYHLIGLSDKADVLRFHMPVLNGTPLTALASSDPEETITGHSVNIVHYAKTYMADAASFDLRVRSMEARVERLDDLVARGEGLLGRRIAAMKLDTEGTEERVLRGASALLLRDRPLLLVETVNSSAWRFLLEMGYEPCNRIDDHLVRSEKGSARGYNHFFVHRDRLAAYRRIGLLRMDGPISRLLGAVQKFVIRIVARNLSKIKIAG